MRVSIFIILCLGLTVLTANAQDGMTDAEYRDFMDRYETAKIYLANHQLERAVPILEELNEEDPGEANINYLLGVCYVKSGSNINKAITHFEEADKKFRLIYDDPGIGAAQYVYYYLTLAHCINRNCDKAQAAFIRFEEEYFAEDAFYLEDARKKVEECKARKTVVPEFRDRLVSTNHKVDTQHVEITSEYTLWGVQVGAYTEPKFTREFKNLKNIGVYVDENGIFRYVIGNFVLRSQALKLLEQVRAAGYNDAFVVDINKKEDERFTTTVTAVDYEPIHFEIVGRIDYRIQVGAFREKIPDHISQMYLELDDIEEYRQGDLTILTVGRFSTYDEAEEYKIQLVEEGYTDAFITAFNYNQKVSLRQAAEHLKEKAVAEGQEIDD